MSNALKSLGCDYIYQDTPVDFKSAPAVARSNVQSEHPAYACKTLEELKNAMLTFKGCAWFR